MSNQKGLSRLSFAGIALLAAALPCLAQTQSGNTRNSQASVLNAGQANEIAALGSERLSVYKAASRNTADAKMIEKQKWSRARFEQSIEQAFTGAPVVKNPSAISESDWEKTRRISSDDEPISPKRITFVSSRGQKLPQS